jgi:hypothetical protein
MAFGLQTKQHRVRAMTSRSIITVGFVVLSGAALWGILAQGRQLSELQAEQKRLESARSITNASAAEAIASPTPEVPRELLQLRAEVARLSQQKRELSSVRAENERLRLQLENRRTNSAARKGGVAVYIRRSEAKWVGYNTPEDTLQSLFWATQNHDLEKVFEAFTPEVAARGKEEIVRSGRSTDEIFKDKALPPGFRIAGRHENGDDSVQLEVEIAPETPAELFLFRQIGRQWKLESPH